MFKHQANVDKHTSPMDPMGYGMIMGLTLVPCLKTVDQVPSLKLTHVRPWSEKGWLEDEKSFWDTIFSGENWKFQGGWMMKISVQNFTFCPADQLFEGWRESRFDNVNAHTILQSAATNTKVPKKYLTKKVVFTIRGQHGNSSEWSKHSGSKHLDLKPPTRFMFYIHGWLVLMIKAI